MRDGRQEVLNKAESFLESQSQFTPWPSLPRTSLVKRLRGRPNQVLRHRLLVRLHRLQGKLVHSRPNYPPNPPQAPCTQPLAQHPLHLLLLLSAVFHRLLTARRDLQSPGARNRDLDVCRSRR